MCIRTTDKHTYTHIAKNASEKNVSKWCPHFQPLWEFCFLRQASARTELPSLTYSIPHHQLVTCDGVISSRKLRTRLRRTPITFTPSQRLYVGHDNNTISFSKRFSVSIGDLSLFRLRLVFCRWIVVYSTELCQPYKLHGV